MFPGAAAAAGPAPGAPIVEVRLEPHDVFDLDKPGGPEKLFRLANAIHVQTRDRVIRRELLFELGDPYDPSILSETERSLRRLPIFHRVEIEAVLSSSGAVVIVRTWDSWTLEIVAHFKRAGGVSDAKAGFADRNLLGSGKSVSAVYHQSGSVLDRTAFYHSPQFLGRRLDYRISGGESTDNRHYSLSLARPFYSSLTRWSLSGGGDYADAPATIYDGLAQAGTVRRRAYNANITYGRAYHAATTRILRMSVGLIHRRAEYGALTSQPRAFVPASERHAGVSLGAEYQELNFIKERRIQKLSRIEDLNLGWNVTPTLVYDPGWRALGSTGSELVSQLTVRKVYGTQYCQYLALRGDYSSTYINGGSGLRRATLDMQYFWHFQERHTLAAHAAFDHGWRLDGPSLLGLGEDVGLRGYLARQFTGNRTLLFSIEDRIFFFENLWKLIDAGGVVFFDSGYAWMPGKRMTLADLKSSVGAGLRLGATRSAGNDPLRIDFARALNGNGLPSRWTISVQAGASFGPN